MSNRWPKVICDPLHRLVPFKDTSCDRLLLDLINTKEFQRLRRIKQLGLSETVFPGSNHSRFAHSIGVMQMARLFLSRMDEVCAAAERPTEEHRLTVLVALLLHDLGHGPFSHAFEKITEEKHEKWTETIILDPSTEINQRLSAYSTELPSKLVVFFDSDLEDGKREEHGIPTYLTQIVSSQFDADRFDYLLRDSYAAGTNAGLFEYNYLIQNLYLDETYKRFFIGHKALLAAEAYVFARYRMYQTVYFHKTTRAAEVMLKLLFARFKHLIGVHGLEEMQERILTDAPLRLYKAFSGSLSLAEFVGLDDYTVSEFLKSAVESSDPPMKDLASGILNRRLYKALDISGEDAHVSKKLKTQVQEALTNAGYQVDFHWALDTASDTPYKPYDPSLEKPSTEIYVENTQGRIEEITKLSDPMKSLKLKQTLVRCYFPAAARDIVNDVAKQVHS